MNRYILLALFVAACYAIIVLRWYPRAPDFVIGERYLVRWWVIPRNRFFNVYLHRIARDDDDRALHDHPWWNLSILLRGSYREITPAGELVRRAGQLVLRRADASHRLEVVSGPVWTLFVTGPVVREWGFHCPNGWRAWTEFVDARDAGTVGRGCE